ncbi:hypothetical protein X741_29340 [Mesorhizobium sp. LNHC229A00]|nr:hypothetical protein X741_29340 [Mesorhizobium sp. LNHC229A00]
MNSMMDGFSLVKIDAAFDLNPGPQCDAHKTPGSVWLALSMAHRFISI